MKVRKCTSLLLGVAVPVPEPRRFELPPPPGFELPPPAHESHAGLASKASSSSPEPCVENLDPWDLFDELDLSDPQEEERFVEEYSVPVARRASLLLPSSMSVGPIKEVEEDMVNDVEEEDMAVDMVNGPILEPTNLPKQQNVGKTARKKQESKPKTKKGKEKAAEESDGSGRGETMYTCKKNDGKKWSCRRPVSQPDTLCSYHSEPKLPGSLRPRRKRVAALGNAADEFYYYDGYGPSRSMRHRGSSSRSVPEPAPAPAEEKEEAQLPAEDHVDIVTPGQDRADVPIRCDNDDMEGYVEDISTDDDDVKRKNPVKRRKRKPVNTRSINSLM
uniref:Uncharacterized protein n=1 Tax=Avena sativa TaxID=4498 RepID=A0ACD5X6A8_AVESA